VAIICGSAAALQPLFVRMFPSASIQSKDYNSAHNRISAPVAQKPSRDVYDYKIPEDNDQFIVESRDGGGRRKHDSEECILAEESNDHDSTRIGKGGYRMGRIRRKREVEVTITNRDEEK
jgi:hypothetical protein